MNSNQNIDIKRVGMALAVLRQKLKGVLKIAPNLWEVDSLENIYEIKAESLEEKLWDILLYGEYYVKNLMLYSAPLVEVQSKGNYDYYINVYKTHIKKIRELIDAQKVPTLDTFQRYVKHYHNDSSSVGDFDEVFEDVLQLPATVEWVKNYGKKDRVDVSDWYENSKTKESFGVASRSLGYVVECHKFIWSLCENQLDDRPADDAREVAVKFIREKLDDDTRKRLGLGLVCFDDDGPYPIHEVIQENCDEIIGKPYFNPDAWEENESDLAPIFVTDAIKKMPTHVQERIHEIHRSFILGNWMSAIALSRCLLEYALINKKSLLAKRLNRKVEVLVRKGRAKPIRELTEMAGEAFPELKESMETVIEYGNYVMHPVDKTIPGRNLAKHCVEEINKIISTLYSPPPTPSQPTKNTI